MNPEVEYHTGIRKAIQNEKMKQITSFCRDTIVMMIAFCAVVIIATNL